MDCLELRHWRSSTETRVVCSSSPPWRGCPSGPTCSHKQRISFPCRNTAAAAEFACVEVSRVEDHDLAQFTHRVSTFENSERFCTGPVTPCNSPVCRSFDGPYLASLLHNSMALPQGNLLHDLVICLGLEGDLFLANCLISMYGRFGALLDARAVFDCMPSHNVVSWTALMTCLVESQQDMEAVHLYMKMKESGMEPNRVSFLTVLSACTNIGSIEEGRQIHASVIEIGLKTDVTLETALIHMYNKCNSLEEATVVFDKMQLRNVVTWTSMISAFFWHEHHEKAILLFWHMQGEHVEPNESTFITVLSACTSLKSLFSGQLIHTLIVLGGFEVVDGIGTSLVTLYGKCGTIKDAASVFVSLTQCSFVSWTAMMTAYREHGQFEDCLLLYKQLIEEGCKPDRATFTIALNACASLVDLSEGKWRSSTQAMAPRFHNEK